MTVSITTEEEPEITGNDKKKMRKNENKVSRRKSARKRKESIKGDAWDQAKVVPEVENRLPSEISLWVKIIFR